MVKKFRELNKATVMCGWNLMKHNSTEFNTTCNRVQGKFIQIIAIRIEIFYFQWVHLRLFTYYERNGKIMRYLHNNHIPNTDTENHKYKKYWNPRDFHHKQTKNIFFLDKSFLFCTVTELWRFYVEEVETKYIQWNEIELWRMKDFIWRIKCLAWLSLLRLISK